MVADTPSAQPPTTVRQRSGTDHREYPLFFSAAAPCRVLQGLDKDEPEENYSSHDEFIKR
jgi:hypothetical protein